MDTSPIIVAEVTDNEDTLEETTGLPKTYLSRFWIVTVLSILAFFQGQQWNHWGPIGASMGAVFGWDAGTVAMMANWGTITFVIFVGPMCWILSAKGLRTGVLTSTLMIAVGTALRCLSFSPVPFTVLCHLGSVLIGIAGTVMLTGPSLVAADWFPPKERTTAMAIPLVLNQLGTASSGFEIFLVRAPDDGIPTEDIKSEIVLLLVIEWGLAFVLLAIVWVYYPSRPPTPPSITSSVERLDYKTAIKSILKNRDLLLVFVSFGLSSVPWESVLNYYLSTLGLHQDEASRLGMIAIGTSALSALITARLTDVLYGHVRASLLVLILATLGFLYWLCLLSWGTIPPVKWQIYATVIGGMAVNFGSTPLFYELAVETAYPCPEGFVTGLLQGTLSVTGIFFLCLFLIPNIGYDWVALYFLGSSMLCVLPLLVVRENYARSKVDQRLPLK